VRCFAFCGEGELRDVEVPHEVEGKVGEEVEGEKKIQKVWTPKREGWDEERDGKDKNWCFLSINASTIEARQVSFSFLIFLLLLALSHSLLPVFKKCTVVCLKGSNTDEHILCRKGSICGSGQRKGGLFIWMC